MKSNKKLLISTFIFFLASSWLFTSCSFKADFSLRVNNQYPHTLTNVMAGPANFGTVSPGQLTSYIKIPEGDINLSGQDQVNPTVHLTGNVSTTGHGKHRWTLTINQDGTVSLKMDK